MQDNPNEQSKPRFLAQDDGKSRQAGPYRGRFLSRQQAEDSPEPPQEADAFPAEPPENPEFPEEGSDALFDASEPSREDISPETLFVQEGSDFQQDDTASLPENTELTDFEEPVIPEYADASADMAYDENAAPSEDAAYAEYTDDI